MRTNRRPPVQPPILTHEGGLASRINPLQRLRRMSLAALLFEDTFYESGSSQAAEVQGLVQACNPHDVALLAVECREKMFLRHMPLFLVRELARTKGNGTLVASTLEQVIQRPDELTEYLALYWRGQADSEKESLSAGSKRGLERAFRKFGAYSLAKYDQDHAVRLKDVMRLVHPRPLSAERSALWRHLINGTLPTPDTWEVVLSAAGKEGSKKEVWERLLKEEKLGGLAFLRNLRNMIEVQVDEDLIRSRFKGKFEKVLPFRFVAALRHAPRFVREMDDAMREVLKEIPSMKGRTGILIDVSGSMDRELSARSEMQRIDAAGGLAVLVSTICESPRIFTFSNEVIEVPPYSGLALIRSIHDSQRHRDTYLGKAITTLNGQNLDRLIVITDEQSHDPVPSPTCKFPYMINVAANRNGVGYERGGWTHIDGWSDRVIDFIQAYEE